MKHKLLIATLLACSPLTVLAHNLSIGQTVPDVKVDKYGEILISGDDTTYQGWSNAEMLGKVRVIQAIAGRSSSKEMNAPLMQAITAAKFSESDYQTTTIINQDDAMWGTGSFVKSSAEDSKQEFPWSSMVLDESGVVASSWGLQEESSAIVVQDKQGKVLFVHEGALDDAQIASVLELVKANL
ncbi:YtfJ family protein [Vibrio paucivorans]|uniref:YtfJ family protein n=1 Tax=Vibrio paucivorans TaxID=2829489 RepID=A0A9X3CHZ2_9VIBR|nr:YtfJ family protein [Vibrio paucivorans]MCW8336243.1 YtfJ family protein [Vibrio paucivorans]